MTSLRYLKVRPTQISQGTVLTQNKAIDGGAIFVLSPNDAATTSSASVSVPSVSLYAEGAVIAIEGAAFLKTQPSDVTAGKKRGAGGGIYASIGVITAQDSIFSKNVAATHGGGIRAVDNVSVCGELGAYYG